MAATKTRETEWYVAAESFATSDGIAYSANITRVRKGHPDQKKFPHLFKPVEASPETNLVIAPEVEQATQAPGEKRARVPAPEPEPEPEPKSSKPSGITTESFKGK